MEEKGESFKAKGATMKKEVTTQDIIKCIDKWTGIRDGKVHVKVGCHPCALCDKTIKVDANCDRCPLFTNGFGCLLSGSNWALFDETFELVCESYPHGSPLPDDYINDLPVPALRQKLLFHIGVMIEHLEICLDQLRGSGPLSVTKAQVNGVDLSGFKVGDTICVGPDGSLISKETKEYVESIQDAYAKTKQHSQQFD
jgi:hypothetical protein